MICFIFFDKFKETKEEFINYISFLINIKLFNLIIICCYSQLNMINIIKNLI